MKKSLPAVLAGLLIVLAVESISVFGPQLQPLNQLGQASVLNSVKELEPVDLKILPSQEVFSLRYGTQSEVLHFGLEASAPYSWRYMSVHYEGLGLDPRIEDPSSWTLYAVDPSSKQWKKIGRGERVSGGDVLIRVEPIQGLPYLGSTGKTDFVVTTTLLKAEDATEAQFKLSIPERGWEWADGEVTSSWISVQNKRHGQDIKGLPGEMLEEEGDL